MSEMVERGARAAMAKVRETSDEVLDPDHYRMLAREVIESMREPTEAMLDAGYEATGHPTPSGIADAWDAMIDVALGTHP